MLIPHYAQNFFLVMMKLLMCDSSHLILAVQKGGIQRKLVIIGLPSTVDREKDFVTEGKVFLSRVSDRQRDIPPKSILLGTKQMA